ncbi:hypothetical protein [Sphingobium sp. EM0848]|uniref:hypothetical protein n=1 Tax=Sphingobium sp. EM0848 TaxID=2743473 RepID=UPI00159C7285|nr:hypothetical protein [Sphingobium sp. EM0848]
MTQWYEKLGAQIGLRVAGLGLLVSAGFECIWLRKIVMANPAADMTGGEFLLAALMFISASAGAALTILGGGLWKPVQLSARWTDGLVAPAPRELEVSRHQPGMDRRGNGPNEKGKADSRDSGKS